MTTAPDTIRLLRFAFVGTVATIVHLATSLLLIERIGISAAAANASAFCVASAISYALNARWTYEAALDKRSLGRFLVVATAGSALAHRIAGIADSAGLTDTTGVMLVIATVPPVTFVLHSIWTFRVTKQSRSEHR